MAEQYEKKELSQHIYDTPDTYVGGIDNGAELQWQERKPKKSKQFATSTNTFFNYSSVC